MLIGYARVSTATQAREGTSLATQREALEAAGAEKIFTDGGVSGARASRPQLDKALEALRDGDQLIVTKLDRLGRSINHLVSLVAELTERGVTVKSLGEGIDTSTSAGRMMLTVFGALAEFERDRIRERTTAGREAAAAAGRKGGRPKTFDVDKIRRAHQIHQHTDMSPDEKAAAVGVTRRTYYRLLKMDPDQAPAKVDV